MPKRKAEESAEIMDAPAKKTKAAPKKSRKTAEEGKCNTLLISRSIHNHGGDANCGGENMRTDISMPYHRGTTDVSAPTAASNRASYPESLPVVHQQRDHLPGAGLPQFRFTPCPSLTLLTFLFPIILTLTLTLPPPRIALHPRYTSDDAPAAISSIRNTD
jgi:hypothetical protein